MTKTRRRVVNTIYLYTVYIYFLINIYNILNKNKTVAILYLYIRIVGNSKKPQYFCWMENRKKVGLRRKRFFSNVNIATTSLVMMTFIEENKKVAKVEKVIELEPKGKGGKSGNERSTKFLFFIFDVDNQSELIEQKLMYDGVI